MSNYDALLLKNQLCFPLYAASRQITRLYKPLLDPLDLTYTQYLVMMILWEEDTLTVSQIGEKLFLDSGTLTPLLKKLEASGYVKRKRWDQDERVVHVSLQPKGFELRDKAAEIPKELSRCINIPLKDQVQLYKLLYSVLNMEDLCSEDPQ